MPTLKVQYETKKENKIGCFFSFRTNIDGHRVICVICVKSICNANRIIVSSVGKAKITNKSNNNNNNEVENRNQTNTGTETTDTDASNKNQ